ncbi:serine/threonine-protein kinase [Streptomyces hirsutus]|uniref:serine/threonine-protein kinase n=1 Tax=Streptomyces hirsutus TaxID=35620 RepID=UPI00364A9DD9
MAGRYRLEESIGQGGMGRVWRAADEMLDRWVAVKEMRMDGLDAEDARTRRERTLREARATARIDHPNVVRVYDVVDEGERLWIVMELVVGRSLERIVAEQGRLSPSDTARVGLGLIAALRQVHARGVLHRDIKPGNVLVENGGGRSRERRFVLTDFGIAAIQDAKALTVIGMLVGSPDYMAPERISGRPQGPPSDLWSLGATLCAALGGRSPFTRDTTLATLHAVLYEEPELPSASGPLSEILTDLLKKEPSDRPGLDDVESALQPVAFPDPTPTLPVAARDIPASRRPTSAPEETQEETPGPVNPESPAPAESPSPSPPSSPSSSPSPPPSSSASPAPRGVSLDRARAVTEQRPHPGPVPTPGPVPLPDPMPPGEPPGPALPAALPAAPRRTGRGRERGGDRRRTVLAAVGGTALAAGAVVAVLLAPNAGSPDDGDRAAASSTTARTASTPSPSSVSSPPSGTATAGDAPPTVGGTSRPATLPPGSRREAGGFAWAPPEGWRRDVQTGAEVHYTSPDGGQELVAKSSLAHGDLLETWQTSERNAHRGRDYRKIRLEETAFRDHPAVVWEYTFTLKGVAWHARLLGFNVDGKSYQINTWYQPHTGTTALGTYEKVKEGFTVL